MYLADLFSLYGTVHGGTVIDRSVKKREGRRVPCYFSQPIMVSMKPRERSFVHSRICEIWAENHGFCMVRGIEGNYYMICLINYGLKNLIACKSIN